MNKKAVFITGASGFIGSHVAEYLRACTPYTVTTLHRSIVRTASSTGRVIGDLLDPATFKEPLLAADVCVHLGGEIDINDSLSMPRERIEHNLSMLFNILEQLRTNGKKTLLIFASTDRVYGRTHRQTVTESEHSTPIEPYTASKMLGETLLEMYSHLYGIPYIVLRLDSVYGPRQPRTMFISDIIGKMLSDDSITTGNLKIVKNFVHVGDVARAVELAIRAPSRAHNSIYNIGGTPTSLSGVVSLLRDDIEKRKRKKIRVTSVSDSRPARIEVRPFRLSTARARDFLKWTPRTTLKRGLKETVDYFFADKTS